MGKLQLCTKYIGNLRYTNVNMGVRAQSRWGFCDPLELAAWGRGSMGLGDQHCRDCFRLPHVRSHVLCSQVCSSGRSSSHSGLDCRYVPSTRLVALPSIRREYSAQSSTLLTSGWSRLLDPYWFHCRYCFDRVCYGSDSSCSHLDGVRPCICPHPAPCHWSRHAPYRVPCHHKLAPDILAQQVIEVLFFVSHGYFDCRLCLPLGAHEGKAQCPICLHKLRLHVGLVTGRICLSLWMFDTVMDHD